MEKEAHPPVVSIDPAQLALLDKVLAAIRSSAEQYLSQARQSAPPPPPSLTLPSPLNRHR